MPTKEECQRMLFKIGIKLGVSPKLISTRLLSKEDKDDMVNGFISQDDLEVAILAWKDSGMPDYANGKFEPYKPLLGNMAK